MKNEHISDALNLLNDDIIEEADVVRRNKRKHGKGWWKWASIAACLALMVYAGIRTLPQEPANDVSKLPLLTINEDAGEAMGFEGYMAYEASELVNANPWSEASKISTLPVYHNQLTYNENGITSGADFNKMQEFLLEVADRFGLDTNTLIISNDVPDEETKQKISEKLQVVGDTIPEGYFDPTKLIAKADGLEIEVNQVMTAKISLNPAISLPGEYNFTHHASYEEIVAVAEYLKTKYKDIIGINNPKVNIYGGDYNIYVQQGYSIEFYEASGSIAEQIINYNFNRVAFYCDDEGKLLLIRIYKPNLSEKVGDYPIINLEEARKLLSHGNYLTTVPYKMPGLDHVKKVELVYRTGEREEYYMPYYRFYVELPEERSENGLKTFGAYYVPAVDGTYIANMPIWNGNMYQ